MSINACVKSMEKLPLFGIDAQKGMECVIYCDNVANLENLFFLLINAYIPNAGHHFEIPAKREESGAYIKKETKYYNEIAYTLTNDFGLPTYDRVRFVLSIPKSFDSKKMCKRLNLTLFNFFSIKRTVEPITNFSDCDSELKKLVNLTMEGNIEEARNILHEKTYIDFGFVIGRMESKSILYLNKWIRVELHENFIEHYFIRKYLKETGLYSLKDRCVTPRRGDIDLLANLMKVTAHFQE